jgi:hypothetical protein
MAKPLPPRRNLDDLAPFVKSCKTSETVFTAGHESRELYVIEEGAIELLIDGTVVDTLGPGDFFGAFSFFHEQPRDTTARATAPSKLLKLDRATFEQLMGEAPEIGVLMLARNARAARLAPPPADIPVAAVPVGAEAAPPASAAPGRLEVPAADVVLVLPALDEIRVGRLDPRAGITPELDLTAVDSDKTVGRRHARLVRRGGEFFVIEDKATANGTFVNGQRIAAEQEVLVPDGAAIRFGMVETVFRRM